MINMLIFNYKGIVIEHYSITSRDNTSEPKDTLDFVGIFSSLPEIRPEELDMA